MPKRMRVILSATLAVLAAPAPRPAAKITEQRSCESLVHLSLPHMKITRAESVRAGQFKLPPEETPIPVRQQDVADLTAFCRVVANSRPTSESDINIELWMPAVGWNGKFQGVGNNGWFGAFSYLALANGLRHGYAVASTDTGHAGSSASFAATEEKLIDWGYRAVHEMTVGAKAIVAAFYGRDSRYSYWTGCSAGGKQGVMEAQRFPGDYDGIVAGSPAIFWSRRMASALWIAQAVLMDPASYIPPVKYAVIHRAVLDACDAQDGIEDGVLDDPRRCRFDPRVLQCSGEDAANCLTAPQAEAARKIYSALRNPRTGEVLFPALEPGSELGWSALAGGPSPYPMAMELYRHVVFKNPNWDYRMLEFDRGLTLADTRDGGVLSATNPDLRKFAARGGKLLMYHGWSDQFIAPQSTVNYYEQVLRTVGADKTRNSVRLFMAPGMGHCGGGAGPNAFDSLAAIEQWVEDKRPPDSIVASRGAGDKADRTRPLCPYPQVARYKGAQSTDDAVNFACAGPSR